ncbi:hypothetical protein HHL22_16740 [Hymenobacter sp. RP-2-7]|uniref:AlgX/AlgJ SGNH hydrolase-like domain-containing protein n=1 Tax=Hymenobacter polaris TaxID=2682546 RepID=A0A7Y0FNY6_9BACT|nr:hypothetical protein [Hymenobacter polaris]NML66854.1 hypothetical protein [Hymenobacter polaris]
MSSTLRPPGMLGKRLVIGLLFLLLLLPAIQAYWPLVPMGALGGVTAEAAAPQFNWEALKTGRLQPALETYTTDHLGFRPWLVRLYNQLVFSGFSITRSPDVLLGKNGVLFMPTYIQAYLGKDVMTADDVRYQVIRIKMLQHDLAQHGINFLFVLAPSKARFEPENLPPHSPPTTSKYDLFTRQAEASHLPLLDCVKLFAAWKRTKPYPLYPRGGTHWSGYATTLIADTLLRQLEASGHYKLRDFRPVGRPDIVRASDLLRGTDNDLGQTLNLLWRKEITPLAYPHIHFEPLRAGQSQPSLLLVSDSYCWGLTQFVPYLQQEFATDSRIWFYNRTAFAPDSSDKTNGARKEGEVEKLNLRQELEKRRTVVLMMTEFNLPECEFWFTSQVFQLYHPFTDADHAAIDQLAAKYQQEYLTGSWDAKALEPEHAAYLAHRNALQYYEAEQMTRLLAASSAP